MGIKVEGEHKGTIRYVETFFRKHGKFPTERAIQEKIAMDHIHERKNYYTLLKRQNL